jgi:hypothetical protein
VLGKMTRTKKRILGTTLVLALSALGRSALGQSAPPATRQISTQAQGSLVKSAFPAQPAPANLPLEKLDGLLFFVTPEISGAPQPLFDFQDSDIKFNLQSLMNTLRDARHENWVLAAYPDPKTSRPLIGAGFGLDVMATEHPQRDPLNPHPFLEPSSAQLWQAAGLDSEKLQIILDQYDRDLQAWRKKNFRRKIKRHQLSPELTDEEAMGLLRISAIQAIHNARAYCREFDQLTASQQMALSQLVFQMGVNLEEFVQFLSAINDISYRDSAQPGSSLEPETAHWKTVQSTLIQSDWARRYTNRAVAVIAMFDPDYDKDPSEAERKVRAQVHPLVRHHRKRPHAKSVQAGNHAGRASNTRTPG